MTARPKNLKRARWIGTEEVARRLSVSRTTLDAMLSRWPGLPGGPNLAGVGGIRRHWRWDAERIEEWFAAYTAKATYAAPEVVVPVKARPPPKSSAPKTAPGKRPSLLAMVMGATEGRR